MKETTKKSLTLITFIALIAFFVLYKSGFWTQNNGKPAPSLIEDVLNEKGDIENVVSFDSNNTDSQKKKIVDTEKLKSNNEDYVEMDDSTKMWIISSSKSMQVIDDEDLIQKGIRPQIKIEDK